MKDYPDVRKIAQKKELPLSRSKNIFTDILFYFLRRPSYKTLITFKTEEEREKYCSSVLQRIGIDVHQYNLINMHQIGIEAPAIYLFNELMKWNGDSLCWPNNLAKVSLPDGTIQNVIVKLLGSFYKLFIMKAVRIHPVPVAGDTDNARYFLYECSGGYPIGIFSIYVRSSIPERGEKEMSQLFFLTSFNFYGKHFWSSIRPIRRIWELIHNPVTNNIAYRFKQLVEWKFENLKHPGITFNPTNSSLTDGGDTCSL